MASLSLRPNHRHHHLATIKPKPKSVYLLCAFFVSHSHGWLEPKPRSSWNPDQAETQIKPKPTLIQEGWSEQRLNKPIPLLRLQRLIRASSSSRRSWRWQRGRHLLHLPNGWELTDVEKNNVEKMLEERRASRWVVEAESEWGVREKEKRSRDKRERKWEKWRLTIDKREKKLIK